MKRINLEQVAQKTGSSLSTVSRAMRNAPGVSAEKRRKILECARTLGYDRRQASRTIAFIIPYLALSHYSTEMMEVLTFHLRNDGFSLEMIESGSIDILEEQNICGAISILSKNGLERIWGKISSLPLLCINTPALVFDGIYSICSDDEDAMTFLINRLLQEGHRNIALYANQNIFDTDVQCAVIRCRTFQQIMHQKGLKDDLIFTASDHFSEEYHTVGRILDSGATAVICTTEGYAPRLIHFIKQHGRNVPRDISVTGWGLTDQEGFCDPPVSCIEQDFNRIGRHAAILFNRLLRHETIASSIVVKSHFRERCSIAPPPGKNLRPE